MSDIDRKVADYIQACPSLAPAPDGRCHCQLVVWSSKPCPACGGYTLERLRQVLSAQPKEDATCS